MKAWVEAFSKKKQGLTFVSSSSHFIATSYFRPAWRESCLPSSPSRPCGPRPSSSARTPWSPSGTAPCTSCAGSLTSGEGGGTWHSSTVLCPACLSCIQQQYAKQHYWALSGLGGTPANNTIVQSKQSNMVQCGSSPPRCFINSLSFVVSSFIFRWDDKILWESVRHQPSFETREHSGGSNHQPFIALSLHSTYKKLSLVSPHNVLQLKEPFSQYFRDF